ncbi:hypothetical protein NLJ89_g11077 [Agrocybe chaxingu]|uniref:Uncharacterized protein n=1 Tax=Agrocybe chaxingu TaxID=84603 RepID=A0A9W8JQ13_9AGAR|nr:hypothetical protein NLJ89_g11077 [Agrocybe chaxingu]
MYLDHIHDVLNNVEERNKLHCSCSSVKLSDDADTSSSSATLAPASVQAQPPPPPEMFKQRTSSVPVLLSTPSALSKVKAPLGAI